ncbi:2-oxo acid dehydrogenase subunit E2 [Mycolicibacterium helvum]|uniref:Dihydrolipoamide acetyltransferase component of pyruvate dehydrogenase complex n=1 Tax=Mycolicibacterium helvum TaxID=1534349 RepID=A0A7I7T8B8_9MYCO|nr:2-oxo acid dehydrogenase subunit E2 [Mycolicibacterium helvum]BBY65512.1 hypothetical protein MHEL_37550 [Mycolicibacterium helvum]
MPVAVTLPDLGESVSEALVSRWLRFPGDLVEEGEPLLEVSTDKVDTEVSAPASGRLIDIVPDEGQTLPVGATLAFIDDTPVGADDNTPSTSDQSASEANTSTAIQNPTDSEKPYVTPLVRRLASEHGIELTSIQGSGVGNRIRKSDVLAAASAAGSTSGHPDDSVAAHAPNLYLSPLIDLRVRQRGLDTSALRGSGHNGRIRLHDLSPHRTAPAVHAPRPDRTEKLTRLRSVIATRMVDSLQTSAQLTTVVEVDVTSVNELRKLHGPAFFAAHGVRLSFTHFFLRAAVDTLADFPALNASIDTGAGTVTYHGAVHLNVAVDTDRGLLAPVIRNADGLRIHEIATATADLAGRARSNTLSVDELSAGTFTVTNTGSRGALFDTPIINQPQVAILGTGAVVARATVTLDKDGHQIVDIRDMAYLSLTYDHRLIDGADAARFLTAIKAKLELAQFTEELSTREQRS